MTLRLGPLPEAVIARIHAMDFEVLDRWFDSVRCSRRPGEMRFGRADRRPILRCPELRRDYACIYISVRYFS
jgi:hypothetical protein